MQENILILAGIGIGMMIGAWLAETFSYIFIFLGLDKIKFYSSLLVIILGFIILFIARFLAEFKIVKGNSSHE